MHLETRFTYHGNMRLRGRSSLSDIEIDTLISSGLAVKAGTEPGTSKVHWIVYSEPDQESIEIVRDERTKEVVTILNEKFFDRQAIPKHFVVLSQTLASLRDKPSLAGINLGALRVYVPETYMFITFVLSSPIMWRTSIRGCRIVLGKMENIHKPWQDQACLKKLWSRLNEELFSEIVIEQVVARISDDEAYSSVLVGETIKRPSS